MKIKLNDGTELNIIQVNGSQRHFQGANRDSLEYVFKKDGYAFDSLDALFADKTKACKVTIVDDMDIESPITSVYDDYSLRISMSLQPVVITPATSEAQEVTEERISVVMGQLTYIEKQLSNLGLL